MSRLVFEFFGSLSFHVRVPTNKCAIQGQRGKSLPKFCSASTLEYKTPPANSSPPQDNLLLVGGESASGGGIAAKS